ncbi:MAG: ATP-binding cassette domain-containing protein [Pseudomonadota bacterium]
MLQISDLTHRYADAQISHLVVPAFSLAQGEHAIIIGPSGSGKSTLLHLIAGILTPQTGALQVAGIDVSSLTSRAADQWRGKTIGFLPQKLALIPSLNAHENILLSAYASGQLNDTVRADALLNALGLADKATAKPHQLSQGQRQRVALARAMFNRPQLLLADEPTANLDDAACNIAIALLLAQVAEIDASLIISTHDARVLHALPQAKVLRLSATQSGASV